MRRLVGLSGDLGLGRQAVGVSRSHCCGIDQEPSGEMREMLVLLGQDGAGRAAGVECQRVMPRPGQRVYGDACWPELETMG